MTEQSRFRNLRYRAYRSRHFDAADRLIEIGGALLEKGMKIQMIAGTFSRTARVA